MQIESAPKSILQTCAIAFSLEYEKAYRSAIVQTKGNVYDAEGIAFEKAHKAWDKAKRQATKTAAKAAAAKAEAAKAVYTKAEAAKAVYTKAEAAFSKAEAADAAAYAAAEAAADAYAAAEAAARDAQRRDGDEIEKRARETFRALYANAAANAANADAYAAAYAAAYANAANAAR